jgi:hypothetical protein
MSQDLGKLTAPAPEKVQNLDILDLVWRVDRFCMEVARAASATRTETSIHDIARQHAMLDRLDLRFQMYAADPELDLPQVHPRALPLPKFPDLNNIENNDSQQILNMLVALRIELTHCDSAERTTAFSKADKGRIEALIAKMRICIAAVEANPELDTPDVNLQTPGVNV